MQQLRFQNKLTETKGIPPWKLFLKQFMNMFTAMLVFAGVLSLIVYLINVTDYSNLAAALFFFIIVILMAILSYHEESKAIRVILGFAKMMPQECAVVRDGQQQTLDAVNLVVGDIVVLKNGSRVPADIRLIQASDVKLETSAMTGESEPLECTALEAPEYVSAMDAHNIAFNSSMTLDGEGFGVVIRTGDNTFIGSLAKLTNEQSGGRSNLSVEIDRFVRFIAILSVTMGLIVFGAGVWVQNGHNVLNVFIYGFVTIIAANVPQGLPGTLLTQLSIIAKRMARRNVYLKNLELIEAFGATTIIASDKTGTITKNIMTVTDIWYNDTFVSGKPDTQRTVATRNRVAMRKRSRSTLLPPAPDAIAESLPAAEMEMFPFERPFADLLIGMCVCNKANIVTSDHGQIKRVFSSENMEEMERQAQHKEEMETLKITGNPSEAAMLRYVVELTDAMWLRSRYEILFEVSDHCEQLVCQVPFNSTRKYHLVICKDLMDRDQDPTKYVLMLKGAPEIVIKRCTKFAGEFGVEEKIDADYMTAFDCAYSNFGEQGRRLIGFAVLHFKAEPDKVFNADNHPTSDLVFIGMTAIMDPPRDDAEVAIRECKVGLQCHIAISSSTRASACSW